MNDITKTFFTALAAVASAAVIAVWLADEAGALRHAPLDTPITAPLTAPHFAEQTLPGTQADQASRPRG